MYRGLWNLITKYLDNSHAVSVFLPVIIVGWTIAGVLVGLIVCALTGTGIISALADLICAGGYAGLILGLFGGCFFLFHGFYHSYPRQFSLVYVDSGNNKQ